MNVVRVDSRRVPDFEPATPDASYCHQPALAEIAVIFRGTEEEVRTMLGVLELSMATGRPVDVLPVVTALGGA